VEKLKVQFILKGFREEQGIRTFVFDRVAPDRTRAVFTIRTDVALTRKHGIRLQELPLLCLEVLAQRCDEQEGHALTYTEEDMRLRADCVARDLEAQKRKRPVRRAPTPERAGAAWRAATP